MTATHIPCERSFGPSPVHTVYQTPSGKDPLAILHYSTLRVVFINLRDILLKKELYLYRLAFNPECF